MKLKNIVKRFNPTTSSIRQRIIIRSPNLYKGSSEKVLTKGLTSTGGRNNNGRITSYHRGGGHKRNYRMIDFNRNMAAYSTATVLRIEYDPNRSANIALCEKLGGEKFYILAADNLKEGDKINGKFFSSIGTGNLSTVQLTIGQTKPLKEFPIGSNVYNLGSKYGRAAGTKVIILKHKSKTTLLRLPSKEIKEFLHTDLATLGSVSNPYHNNRNLGKAGASAWIGRLPRVKGIKMNPIDHPHGGKTPVSGGKGSPARNRWGRLAKWQKLKK